MKKKFKKTIGVLLTCMGAVSMQAQNSSSYNLDLVGIGGNDCNAYGWDVLTANVGDNNTGVGFQCLRSNIRGERNTGIGYQALMGNTYGNDNTAAGYQALLQNFVTGTSGNANTAIGDASMLYNDSGNDNTAVGRDCMARRLISSKNTAQGWYALGFNFDASFMPADENLSFGDESMTFNITGGQNTVFGARAHMAEQYGFSNTAVGYQAHYLPFKGGIVNTDNTAIGCQALEGAASSGAAQVYATTAVGYQALLNSEGNENVAVGAYSQSDNASGRYNVAFGSWSLEDNQDGDHNVAIGSSALALNNNTAGRNIAIGHGAGSYNPSCSDNVSIGSGALAGSNAGNQNTFVGAASDMNGTYSNVSVLGAYALGLSNDEVRIGNGNVTVIQSTGPYGQGSDRRFKFDVNENEVPGRKFINLLRPVTYNFESKKLQEYLTRSMPDSIRKVRLAQTFPDLGVQSGFLAQEVEAAMAKVGYDFVGLNRPANQNDVYSLAYSAFVVPLVQAVKEQQQEIKQTNALNNELRERVRACEAKLKELEPAKETAGADRFYLEAGAEGGDLLLHLDERAQWTDPVLCFYDLAGEQLRSVKLPAAQAQVPVDAGSLSAGLYYYTVISGGAALPLKVIAVER